MYTALLTNRYLSSRVIPLIAVAAVALCVALVIIVVSVMTGFLEMVKTSGRTLVGDVVISYPVSGLPHYDRLIEHLEKFPEVAAASPIVNNFGLMQMPYPDGAVKDTHHVIVWGIEPESFAAVTGYDESLHWRPMTEEELEDAREDDFRRIVGQDRLEDVYENGRLLQNPGSETLPGVVLGMHVSIGNDRQSDGTYEPKRGGYWWMPEHRVVLTLIPVGEGGSVLQPQSIPLQVVNEFMSGVFMIDETRVLIPLDVAQRGLGLDEAILVDEEDPSIIEGVSPARATMVLVRAADGVPANDLRAVVEGAYHEFSMAMHDDDTVAVKPPLYGLNLSIQTWEQQQAKFIAPIEKERELMRTLFSLIYVVCAGLVLAIFWAIVYEKTRDIGILRSVGASRLGISWIFVRYGVVIGVLGAVAGLGLGWLVVHNINTIHTAMGDPPEWLAAIIYFLALGSLIITIARAMSGRLLPLVLGGLVTITLAGAATVIVVVKVVVGGVVIWDPSVYYFTEIPNSVDFASAGLTMVGAVLFSLIGAFLPAAKAADTDPVKALRYE